MIVIAQATVDDAQAMHDLQQRAFAEEARRSGTRQIRPLLEPLSDIVDHIRHQSAITARSDGAIVGSIRGVVEGGVCTIRALAVDPSCQGRGIGSQLLLALERLHTGVERFDLTTNTVMEGNVPFYERHGYVLTSSTRHSDIVTLAHMTKPAPGRG